MSNPEPAPAPVRRAPVTRDRCGMALACDLLGDRWSMLILREAFYGVSRFDDLRADLGAPRGILSARLKALVAAGVLERHPYRDGTARMRHEYRLSARGQELALPLLALMQWGDRHLRDGQTALRLFSAQGGAPLHVALVTPDGRAVAPQDVRHAVVEG